MIEDDDVQDALDTPTDAIDDCLVSWEEKVLRESNEHNFNTPWQYFLDL